MQKVIYEKISTCIREWKNSYEKIIACVSEKEMDLDLINFSHIYSGRLLFYWNVERFIYFSVFYLCFSVESLKFLTFGTFYRYHVYLSSTKKNKKVYCFKYYKKKYSIRASTDCSMLTNQ